MLLLQPDRSKKSWTKYPAVEERLDGKLPLVQPPTPIPLDHGTGKGQSHGKTALAFW